MVPYHHSALDIHILVYLTVKQALSAILENTHLLKLWYDDPWTKSNDHIDIPNLGIDPNTCFNVQENTNLLKWL